ncbi:MAG: glycerate kinase [Gemmatimonadota bacterium]
MLVCPTAFKGSLSAAEATRALARGARAAVGAVGADLSIISLPVSDGGNGLLEALAAERGGEWRVSAVRGPLGEVLDARYLAAEDYLVVEAAEACGLHLVPREGRDPLRASTRGVGELLRAASEGSPTGRVVLGLGGSATVDGGAGMARALGWRLLDARGRPIADGASGLPTLRRLVPPEAGQKALGAGAREIIALADVAAPLTGPAGAARVFAPQKGASPEAVAALEEGLANLAERIAQELGVRVAKLPGGGAAGGLGAGAVAFLGARLEPGAAWVLDAIGFDRRLARARVLLTGEGAYDRQTSLGKVVGVLVARARAAGVPAVVVAGRSSAPPAAGVVVRAGGGDQLGPAELAALAEDGVRAALAATC